jgi:hypothetical protein
MQPPSWAEFDDTRVTEFRPRAPQAELAEVLRRYRADLDAAARSAAKGRAEGLRALADQAVLAVELERLLEAQRGTLDARSAEALRRLKDRMLARVEEANLEVVRLRGKPAAVIRDMVEIEQWRLDDAYPAEIVVEELEAAVRLHGEILRKGRVVMGAPRRRNLVQATAPAGEPARSSGDIGPVALGDGGDGVVCPVEECGTRNAPDADVCAGCLTLLGGYRRLSRYPEILFNRGLRAARAGDLRGARDLFAAVAFWIPHDARALNAYALACFEEGDLAAAERAWAEVLSLAPGDAFATRGCEAVAATRRAAAG